MNRAPESDIVRLRCPRCNRFIADVKGYGRGICRECGAEITYRSREERVTLPASASKEAT